MFFLTHLHQQKNDFLNQINFRLQYTMVIFGSLNVNGMRNPRKRQNIYHWLEKQHYDIICLQETHCGDSDTENDWKQEWGGKSVWNNGINTSKGVATLFRNGLNIKIESGNLSDGGRIILLKLNIDDFLFQLINVSSQNNPAERKRFLRNLTDTIDVTLTCITVIAGDFNCVFDLVLDRSPSGKSKDWGCDELQGLINILDLEDVFRKREPTKHSYSFFLSSVKIPH